MLDDYKDNQNIIYKTLINSIKKNTISHAYLIELSDTNLGLDLAIAISKFLLCPKHNTNNISCKNCNICHQIDTNNYLELKIIRPDGKFIKKNQIHDLQEQFKMSSVFENYKIYIIEEAEKLNEEAANSLLKFLEEPTEGIIAILLTNNIYQVYNTIKSRCQILKSKNNMTIDQDLTTIEKISNYLFSLENEKIEFLNDENKDILKNIIEYVTYLEDNKLKTIIFKNKFIIQIITNNLGMENFFKILVLIYKDILNIILSKDLNYFNEYSKKLEDMATRNNEISITKKLNIIIDLSTKISYNVNANLLLDKLVILFKEV